MVKPTACCATGILRAQDMLIAPASACVRHGSRAAMGDLTGMIFSRKPKAPPRERTVSISDDVRDGILSYSKMRHPNEAILILRGKSKDAHIHVDGLVVPPFSHSGPTFAGFPHSFLPFDKSYIGMFHSHPSGTARPSVPDLHNFFGLVSVIVAYPYGEDDICAWDSSGTAIRLVDPAQS